eukprot:3560348-Amphidinium_carterae.1
MSTGALPKQGRSTFGVSFASCAVASLASMQFPCRVQLLGRSNSASGTAHNAYVTPTSSSTGDGKPLKSKRA